MSNSVFERVVQRARAGCLESLEMVVSTAQGLVPDHVMGRDGELVEVPTRVADRLTAFKILSGIVMSKEALGVRDIDEYEMLSPLEKVRVLSEELKEAQAELEGVQVEKEIEEEQCRLRIS